MIADGHYCYYLSRDENKSTALHFSALSGGEELTILIASLQPSYEQASTLVYNSLPYVIDNPISSSLIQSRDSQGCLPLHWAAKHGHASLLQYLVPDGQIDAQDETSSHWTALHYASASNKLDACKWLLEHGANKLMKDSHDRTPLDLASERSYLSLIDILKS